MFTSFLLVFILVVLHLLQHNITAHLIHLYATATAIEFHFSAKFERVENKQKVVVVR